MMWVLGLAQVVAAQTPRADILIRNGRLYDGTGNAWIIGDVAVRAGRIEAVGRLPADYPAETVLDARGLAVAPGFIDVHTHIEDDELRQPTADNFIYDGVTTVITGNCGSSRLDLRRYFQVIDSARISVNVASLIGHGNVRKAVLGRARRGPSEEELRRMEALVDSAMRAGAVGLSSGLIYVPGTYARTPELVRLARVAARHGGLYATHMRNEGDSVAFALEEALRVGREAALPVQISHLKLSGPQNWGRTAGLLERLETARRVGQEVTIDQYPYTASSTYALRLRYLLDSISRGQQPTAAIDKYLQVERARYPASTYLMYFTSSHDINSWDGTEYERLGPDAQTQAVLTALLPGIPMVYSGQEAALKKRLRFFDKDTIPWNDYPLQDFYTRLLQLKKRHPALRNGDPCSQFTRLPSPTGTYAFARKKDEAAVLTFVNLTNKPQTVTLPATAAGRFQDVFSAATVELEPQQKLTVPAHGWRVLEKQAAQTTP